MYMSYTPPAPTPHIYAEIKKQERETQGSGRKELKEAMGDAFLEGGAELLL
jgi:hypothetical protein